MIYKAGDVCTGLAMAMISNYCKWKYIYIFLFRKKNPPSRHLPPFLQMINASVVTVLIIKRKIILEKKKQIRFSVWNVSKNNIILWSHTNPPPPHTHTQMY